MTDLIKQEILTTIKKKRFMILTALLFAGAVFESVMTKGDLWNDQTYFLAMQDYIQTVFTPFIGIILLLSVYRLKYTRSSILQVEEKSLKRSQGVIARAVSGSVILLCCYVLMALFVILLGLILGAHLSSQQTVMLMLRLLTDCLAAAAAYISSLFFLYLFAFPAVPMIWYAFLTFAAPVMLNSFIDSIVYRVCNIIFPKPDMDVFYTGLILSAFRWECVLFLAGQILIPLLLTFLVFKLKKLKPEKAQEEEAAEPSETGAATEASEGAETEPAAPAQTLEEG